MAKKKAKSIGEVTITRGETDDEARDGGAATWRLEAGLVRGCIMRSLRGPASEIAYHVSSWRRGDARDPDVLIVGPSTVVRELDFAAAVAKAKELMARAAR